MFQSAQDDSDRTYAIMTKQRRDLHAIIEKMKDQEFEIAFLQNRERKKRVQEIRLLNQEKAKNQKEQDLKDEREAIRKSELLMERAKEIIDANKEPSLEVLLDVVEDVNSMLWI